MQLIARVSVVLRVQPQSVHTLVFDWQKIGKINIALEIISKVKSQEKCIGAFKRRYPIDIQLKINRKPNKEKAIQRQTKACRNNIQHCRCLY